MYKKIILLFATVLVMVSCGSSTKVVVYKKPRRVTNKIVIRKTTPFPKTPNKTTTKIVSKPSIADKIVWTAVTYKGVPYKFGGMSKKGIDCSGLIYTSFKQRNITIPRSSREMYSRSYDISLKSVKRGDLLFFKTSRRKGRVNHVGLVTSVKNGDIRFIHATSSKGVIVTSLHTRYWKKAFVKAKRIL